MKISLGHLSTTNLYALAERLINASKYGKYQIVEGNVLLSHLQTEYEEYGKSVVKKSFSGMGKSIAQLDEERDYLFLKIRNYLKSYADFSLLPHYEDAQELFKIFELHNLSLDRLSYAEESVMLSKLLAELDKETNKQKLKNLLLETAYTQLKEKQEEFETTYKQQIEANAELRLRVSASSIRKKLEKAIRDYLNLVSAMKDYPDWKELYAELNEIVKAARNS